MEFFNPLIIEFFYLILATDQIFLSWLRFIQLPKYIILAPIILAAVIGHWNKLHHMSVAIVLPEYVDEYADNKLLGDVLSYVPTKLSNDPIGSYSYRKYVLRHPDLLSAYEINSDGMSIEEWGKQHYDNFGKNEGRVLNPPVLLVTNNFSYVKWPDSKPQIPALFGHHAYGVNLRHFVGPRGYNLHGARHINHQLNRLSRSFKKYNPEFSKETIRQAAISQWTHFILKKDIDDGLPALDADDIPLKKLHEHGRYAIFEF